MSNLYPRASSLSRVNTRLEIVGNMNFPKPVYMGFPQFVIPARLRLRKCPGSIQISSLIDGQTSGLPRTASSARGEARELDASLDGEQFTHHKKVLTSDTASPVRMMKSPRRTSCFVQLKFKFGESGQDLEINK
jgi:hypothetical protein